MSRVAVVKNQSSRRRHCPLTAVLFFGSALIAGRDYLYGQAVSAYHHVSNETKYPAVMGVTGVKDPRVPSWIVAKFIAPL